METVKDKMALDVLAEHFPYPRSVDFEKHAIKAMEEYASIQTSELRSEITALNEDVRLLKESGSAKIKQYTELKAENEELKECIRAALHP